MQPKPWAETTRPWEPSLRRGMDMRASWRRWPPDGRRRGSECERAAGLEQVGEAFSRERFTEQVTLHALAAVGAQELTLAAGLYTFRHRHHLEVTGHADDGGHDGGIIHVQVDVAHEGLVDLELVQVKAP